MSSRTTSPTPTAATADPTRANSRQKNSDSASLEGASFLGALKAGRVFRAGAPYVALAGGLGALEMVRSRFQRRRIFLPSRYPSGIWEPSAYGLTYEDVWFDSEDGLPLHGWWIEHPRAVATLVYCHGTAGNISDHLTVYRYLRRLKVNVFAFDYRGYGRSAGEPTEKGLFSDVRAALDWVQGERGIEPGHTVLFGHSLGGAVAIDGALHRPVAGLVVQSSFTDIRDMARHFYRGLGLHWLTRNEFRSISKVGLLELPKLFIHGSEDGTIPLTLGRRLYEAAAEPKSFLSVDHAGHNDVHRFGGPRYIRALGRFCKRCVG